MEAQIRKRRDYYVYDNKKVNEQKCKDDGFHLLNRGEVDVVGIHYHPWMIVDVETPCDNTCYDIKKGDEG